MARSREVEWVPDAALIHGRDGIDSYLSEAAQRRILRGIPFNTRVTYSNAWKKFVTWCAREGRTPLPATAQTLAEYVTYLCEQGVYDRELGDYRGASIATIDQAIAVIRAAHHGAGYPNQPDTLAARKIVNGYARDLAEEGRGGQREAKPITIEALRRMIEVCDLETPIGLRDRLTLVLGLALMGRRSELVNLNIADVRVVEEGLEVLVRFSKTDQTAKGELVAIPAGTHPLTNPVAAYQDWVQCLADHGITSGRLLRSISKHGHIGEKLSTNAVNAIVKKLAHAAGLDDPDAYSAHSLRAGGATVAYAAGVPVSTIAKHGRWKPNSPVVFKYIRAVDKWRDNAMRNVGL